MLLINVKFPLLPEDGSHLHRRFRRRFRHRRSKLEFQTLFSLTFGAWKARSRFANHHIFAENKAPGVRETFFGYWLHRHRNWDSNGNEMFLIFILSVPFFSPWHCTFALCFVSFYYAQSLTTKMRWRGRERHFYVEQFRMWISVRWNFSFANKIE